MWLLTLLPDSFMYLIVISIFLIGLAGYILGSFGGVFPLARPHANTIKLVSIGIMIVGVYLYGGYTTEMNWRNKVVELEAKVAAAEAKSQIVNTVIKEKIVTKIKRIKDTKIQIQKEIVEKIKIIDAECIVPAEAVEILNKAAEGPKGTDK